jgi:hypothetical protein
MTQKWPLVSHFPSARRMLPTLKPHQRIRRRQQTASAARVRNGLKSLGG